MAYTQTEWNTGDAITEALLDKMEQGIDDAHQRADATLPKDGSEAMTGALDMGGAKVSNVGTPTLNADAATKSYVDSAAAAGIPSGVIVMWSGSPGAIPAGWHLCDGANGTPNLQDRFIVGAGAGYTPGDTGGEASHALTESELPSHTHGDGSLATSSAGSHSHGGSTSTDGLHSHDGRRTGTLSADGSANQMNIGDGPTASAGDHSHSITTDTAAAHTHSITGDTGATGGGDAHENRPPYYALAFIMKA